MKSHWEVGHAEGAYAYRQGDYVHIGNQYLERVLRLSEDVVRTVELINRVSGRPPVAHESTEFVLELSGALQGEFATQDFRLADSQATEVGAGALRLIFALECRQSPALRAEMVLEAYDERKFQRKWLLIRWEGEGDVRVERVDVEVPDFGWWNVGAPAHCGYGQPVLVSDLYMGLEYPAAETDPTALRHFPGRSAKGGLQSKCAIWGVAPSAAQVRDAFLQDYLATRLTRPPRPFIIYNLLGAGIPEEQRLLPWIERIGQETEQAGFHIDSFAIDDLWQDESTLWQPAPRRFPDGFGRLAEAAQRRGSRLGLWMALSGYTLDTRWGRLRGLEVTQEGDRSHHGRYCLAGPNYAARLKEVLETYIVRDGVNYFKFDYNDFGCDNPTHDHPTGRAGKEAQIDAFLSVLQHVKAVSPDVFIAITTGMWLSPWWIPDADAVWLGGYDLGTVEQVPCLTPHDSVMTYRDTILYDDFMEQRYVFPYTAVMTHGFWVGQDVPISGFKDDVMMTLGRGITKWEILTSPQDMNAKRYAFLGQAIRWGKANWDILAQTQMILGDPRHGEVYGYAHRGEGAALVFLRNPALESRMIDLSLETIGVPSGSTQSWPDPPLACEVYPVYSELDWRYPQETALQIEMPGCQCKCIAVVWDANLAERIKL